MQVITWTDCYSNQWRDLIVPESFVHPAKVAPGLAERIFKHAIEQGYIEKGSVCGDPFGGIGGFAIYGAYAGLQFVCVELEEKFCGLFRDNISLHRATWEAHGYPVPIILQGDSRRFSEIVGKCAAHDCKFTG